MFVIFNAIFQQETCQFFDHDINNFYLNRISVPYFYLYMRRTFTEIASSCD